MLFGHCDSLRLLIITRVQILALFQFLPVSGPVQRVSRQHHLQQQQQGPCLLVVHQRLRVQLHFKSTPSTTRLGNYLKSPIEATWEAINKFVISHENHCNQSNRILEKKEKSLKDQKKNKKRSCEKLFANEGIRLEVGGRAVRLGEIAKQWDKRKNKQK